MKRYTFRVIDADGAWGELRIAAASEAEAREKCAAHLNAEETGENGSLALEYDLALLNVEDVS